jgi:hypothetical protein
MRQSVSVSTASPLVERRFIGECGHFLGKTIADRLILGRRREAANAALFACAEARENGKQIV